MIFLIETKHALRKSLNCVPGRYPSFPQLPGSSSWGKLPACHAFVGISEPWRVLRCSYGTRECACYFVVAAAFMALKL